jgi:hypothetical protein
VALTHSPSRCTVRFISPSHVFEVLFESLSRNQCVPCCVPGCTVHSQPPPQRAGSRANRVSIGAAGSAAQHRQPGGGGGSHGRHGAAGYHAGARPTSASLSLSLSPKLIRRREPEGACPSVVVDSSAREVARDRGGEPRRHGGAVSLRHCAFAGARGGRGVPFGAGGGCVRSDAARANRQGGGGRGRPRCPQSPLTQGIAVYITYDDGSTYQVTAHPTPSPYPVILPRVTRVNPARCPSPLSTRCGAASVASHRPNLHLEEALTGACRAALVEQAVHQYV